METLMRLRCCVAAALLALSLVGCGKTATPQAAGAPAYAAEPGDLLLGASDAKVTLVVYGSVSCRACAKFQEKVFPLLKANFIDPGFLNYVFREYPTTPLDLAFAGSAVTRCIGEKEGADAYYSTLNALLTRQDEWIWSETPPAIALGALAAEAGLDAAAYQSCLSRRDVEEHINRSIKRARELYDIRRAPSLVLNGELMNVTSYYDLFDAIDKAAGRTQPTIPRPPEAEAEDGLSQATVVGEPGGVSSPQPVLDPND